MLRPIIGIPCAVVTESWYGPVFGNYVSYVRAVEAAGGIPQLIQQTPDQQVLERLYASLDGLLLAGGDDVDPARYGEAPLPWLEATSPAQDAVELVLFAWARRDKLPVLGICRGLQLINVALGGALYQDIAQQRADSLDHRIGNTRRDWRYLAHPMALQADSWLAARLDTDAIAVNSLHHQGIKALAPGLRAVGHAPDGLVEAIESDDGRVVALQCHPEELWQQTDERWTRLFTGFVEGCTR
jgi:putative glutamine amidotransferase